VYTLTLVYAGGCCSVVPYEAALAMLEVEGEVLAHPMDGGHGGATAAAEPCLAPADSEDITRKMAHAFPWSPAAGVHLALALRKRATSALAQGGKSARSSVGGTSVTVIGARGGHHPGPADTANRRKFLIRVGGMRFHRFLISGGGHAVSWV